MNKNRNYFSIFAQKSVMDILNNDQKIAIMRVLLDIIYADGRTDIRGTAYYSDILNELHLSAEYEELIQRKSSLIALLDIKNFALEQKEYFAAIIDKVIKVDQEINVNEVVIYDVVIEFCGIPISLVA